MAVEEAVLDRAVAQHRLDFGDGVQYRVEADVGNLVQGGQSVPQVGVGGARHLLTAADEPGRDQGLEGFGRLRLLAAGAPALLVGTADMPAEKTRQLVHEGNGVSVSVSASDMSPGEDVESHVSAGVKLTLQVVESEFPCPQVTVTFAVTVVGNLPSFAVITFVNSSGDGGSSQHVATTLNLTGVLFTQPLYV